MYFLCRHATLRFGTVCGFAESAAAGSHCQAWLPLVQATGPPDDLYASGAFVVAAGVAPSGAVEDVVVVVDGMV